MDDYLWLMGRAGYKPVIEYCGGTEIGGGFVTGSLLQPQALSAFSTPAMGCNLFILDSSGNPLVSSWNDGIGFFFLNIYVSTNLTLCPTASMYCLQIMLHIISGFFFASL